MNKIYFLTLLFLALVSSKITHESKTENLKFNKTAEIDSLGSRYLDLGRFSGVILIREGDSVIYNNSFGLADYENEIPFSEQTSFKIGEVSELITSNIIRELAHTGKLKLSDPVSTYLPEIKAGYTLDDLLSHKSGLADIQAIREANPELAYSAVQYANLAAEIGGTVQPSDLGYNLLGLVIGKVTGKNFQEVVDEYSSRLGLENTYFEKADPAAAVGYLFHNFRGSGLELQRSPSYDPELAFSSNGLKSTARDLAIILNHTPATDIDIDGYLEKDGFSYSGEKNSETNRIIIVLSNRRHPVAKEISNSIAAIFQEEPYELPLLRKPFSIDPMLLQDYSGTYSLKEQMNLEVVNENDSLFVMMGPNKIHLIPQSVNQFYLKERDAAMRFLRDSNHTVHKAVLLDGFLEGTEIKRKK